MQRVQKLRFAGVLFVASIFIASGSAIAQTDGGPDIFLPLIQTTGESASTIVAVDDLYETPSGTPLAVAAATGVLANDTTDGPDTLQAVLVDDVANGVLTLAADGSFLYVPNPSFSGQDRFIYQATDGNNMSEPAIVTLNVEDVAGAPIARNDGYTTTVGIELIVSGADGVLANDTPRGPDTLQAELVDSVASGVLSLAADGSFTYMPDADFIGQDSFTYRAANGIATSEPATVSLQVLTENSPPQILSGQIDFVKNVIGNEVDETHVAVGADLDRDGDMDVAATDYVDGLVLWYQNDGSGNFTEKILDSDLEGAYPAGVGDVDLDGHVDVLAAGYDADTFVWYRNDGGGAFTRFVVDDASDGAHSIVAIDFDDDDDIDFVTSSQDANRIAWYENDGSQNFTEKIIDSAALGAKRAEVADIDDDGDLDVAAASFEGDEIAWHRNDGNQNFTKEIIDTTADGAYYVSPADVDGDGDIDIFTASQLDNTIAWYENEGEAGFTKRIIDSTAEGARSVFAVDMDRDGDADTLSAAKLGDTFAWHINDGNGNFTKRIIDESTPNADGAYGITAVDMDYDGDEDILTASKWSSDVVIHTQVKRHDVTVDQGGTRLIDTDTLLTVDNESGPAEIIYTLQDAPQSGQISVGDAVIGAGGNFTQADIDSGRLAYTHGGVNAEPDEFTFSVADDGQDGVQAATGFVVITIVSERR